MTRACRRSNTIESAEWFTITPPISMERREGVARRIGLTVKVRPAVPRTISIVPGSGEMTKTGPFID